MAQVILESTEFNDRHRNIVRLSVADQIQFEFSYLGQPALEFERIYRQTMQLYNWLADENASVVAACPDQNRMLMFSIVVYQDS